MMQDLLAVNRQLLATLPTTAVEVEARKTIAAAGDYTAGDVVSENATAGTAWKFENCARFPGRPFYITSVQANCSEDSITAMLLRIHWFIRDPNASVRNDNVAMAHAQADRPAYRGFTDLTVFVDLGDFSAIGDDTIRKLIVPDPSSRDLYAIVETRAAEANETANMNMTITLGIEQL